MSLALCILCLFAAVLAGCQEKRKTLVSAHTAVGELLISTRAQAKTLYNKKVINQGAYDSIRANWLRAQTIYLQASDLLETIIGNDQADIGAYAQLITQANTILSDIAVWLSETKNPKPETQNSTKEAVNEPIGIDSNSAAINPPGNQPGVGNPQDSGDQRDGQGGAEKVSPGNEGQSGVGDVGITATENSKLKTENLKLTVQMTYSAVFKPGDAFQIHGVTDSTADVRIWLTVGSIVYTLDGSEPSFITGAHELKISQCIILNPADAVKFRAKVGDSGACVDVMILGGLK